MHNAPFDRYATYRVVTQPSMDQLFLCPRVADRVDGGSV